MIKISDKNLTYTSKIYDIFDDKHSYFLDIYNTIAIKQLKFYEIFLSILFSKTKDYFISNINQNMRFVKRNKKNKEDIIP